MRGLLLAILNDTGPLVIRTSRHADKRSPQDLALLGSLAAYADNLNLSLTSICTDNTLTSVTRSALTMLLGRVDLALKQQQCAEAILDCGTHSCCPRIAAVTSVLQGFFRLLHLACRSHVFSLLSWHACTRWWMTFFMRALVQRLYRPRQITTEQAIRCVLLY